MTTGSKEYDKRKLVDGKRVVGTYVQKTWSGADQLPNPPLYNGERVVVPPKYAYVKVPWSKQRARMLVRAGYSYYKNKPPARARRFDNHNYDCSFIDLEHGSTDPGLQIALNGSTTYNWYTYSSDSIELLATRWNSNDDLAILGKLREATVGSDFNAGIFLGEGKQSLSLITDTARRLYLALKATRRGNFQAAAKHLTHGYDSQWLDLPDNIRRLEQLTTKRRVARSWLELQYGWFPMIQDMKAGAEFLAHNFSIPLRYKVSVTRNAGGLRVLKFPRPGVPGIKTGVSINNSTCRWAQGEHLCSKRATIYFKERNTVALSGLTDPFAVAWELVPYSFVIDWALPIGQYLEARGFSQALDATLVWDIRNSVKGYGGITSDIPAYAKIHSKNNSSGTTIERGTFSRFISPGFNASSIPLPTIKPLGKVAGWERATNALALLCNRSYR